MLPCARLTCQCAGGEGDGKSVYVSVNLFTLRCCLHDVAEPKPKSTFTEALCAFEYMRAFMYAHDITERDQANIINIESLLFS